jgi:NAD(P)-dependent dehydrogenase (short-subunit alcohol dehydrogenase family)
VVTQVSIEIDLSGMVAVVTGGTRGIGREISESLAAAGTDVVPTSRTDADVADAVEAVKSYGVSSFATTTDVTEDEQLRTLFERTRDDLGSVDIVVNNAGVNPRSAMGSPEAIASEEFDTAVDINLRGAYSCTHEAGKYLLEDGGSVINIASVSGIVGTPRQHSYTASKHGLVGLTKSVALDWAPEVRVNTIAPGYVSTDLTEPIKENDQLYQSIREDIPYDRFADPEEIASAVVFLASDMASYITGECLAVDGGWTAK